MSKTIEGIPEFITYDQYLALFASCGVEPSQVVEMRMAGDGVHVLLFALDERGRRRIDLQHNCFYKHRVFIPVRRDADDTRTTRVSDVVNSDRDRDEVEA